jgi:hypothetical protein
MEGLINDRGTHANHPSFGLRDLTDPYPYGGSGWWGAEYAYLQADGDLVTPAGTTSTFVPAFVDGDMWGVAVDVDNKALYFAYKPAAGSWTWANSATVGEIEAGTTTNASHTWSTDTPFLFSITGYSAAQTADVTTNFGATAWNDDNFQPTGFVGLATQNLPTPDVINYEDHYTVIAGISHSNGSTTAVTLPKSVSGGAMVRLKRTDAAGDWIIFDTIRGVNKALVYNEDDVQDTSTYDDQNLTGTTFTIPSGMASGTYLLECFYVGDFFQITAYTGNDTNRNIAFASALDTAPGMMYIKNLNTASRNGIIYHQSTGNTHYLRANSTTDATDSATRFNDTSPTTAQFTVGTENVVNQDGKLMICYAWANSGPYAFGDYTGNGNADGPVISINGSPASYFNKATTDTQNWFFETPESGTNNPVDDYLAMDTTAAFATSASVRQDFNSNGVKNRATSGGINGSAVVYIYGAFGIQPMTDGAINQVRAK